MLLVCIVQGWSLRIEKAVVFFPGEDHLSSLSISELPVLVRAETWKVFSHWHPCWEHVKTTVLVRFHGWSASVSRKHILTENVVFPLPLLKWSLRLGCRSWGDVWAGTRCCNFTFWSTLWFSGPISICCKENFPWWGVRIALTCRYKDYVNIVKQLFVFESKWSVGIWVQHSCIGQRKHLLCLCGPTAVLKEFFLID